MKEKLTGPVKKIEWPIVPADPLAEINRKASSLEGIVTANAKQGILVPRRFRDVHGKIAYGKALTACLEKGVLDGVLPKPELAILQMTKGAQLLYKREVVNELVKTYSLTERQAEGHIARLEKLGAITIDPTEKILGRAACIEFEAICAGVQGYGVEAGAFKQVDVERMKETGETGVFDHTMKPADEFYARNYEFGLKLMEILLKNWIIQPVEETATTTRFELTNLGKYAIEHFWLCPLPAKLQQSVSIAVDKINALDKAGDWDALIDEEKKIPRVPPYYCGYGSAVLKSLFSAKVSHIPKSKLDSWMANLETERVCTVGRYTKNKGSGLHAIDLLGLSVDITKHPQLLSDVAQIGCDTPIPKVGKYAIYILGLARDYRRIEDIARWSPLPEVGIDAVNVLAENGQKGAIENLSEGPYAAHLESVREYAKKKLAEMNKS